MQKTNVYLLFPLFIAILFTVSTGCEDSTPEPEPLPDVDDMIIDSSMTRLSMSATYLDGQLNNTRSFSYAGGQITQSLQHIYEAGLLVDSTLTVYTYEGEDIVKTRYVYEAGLTVLDFRSHNAWEAGQCTSILREFYENGSWVPSSSNTFVYTGENTTQDILANMVDGVLTPVNIRTFTYEDGQATYFSSESVSNGELALNGKHYFEYDGDYLMRLTDTLFNTFTNEFYLGGKTEYLEGMDGLLSREGFTYDLDTQQFELFNSNTYVYDSEGKLIRSEFEATISSESESYTEYTYALGAGNYQYAFLEPNNSIFRRPLPQ